MLSKLKSTFFIQIYELFNKKEFNINSKYKKKDKVLVIEVSIFNND